jgi:alcohol dehydrogenase
VKAVIAERLGQPWVTAGISDPQPGARDLLVQVEASSVCHTDIRLATDARFGGTFPRIPGHEFVGRVVEKGRDVQEWDVGDRVGVAWAQRWCGKCRQCLEQSYSFCERGNDVTGGTVDGGHAEYAVVDALAAVPLPVQPPADQLAPLMCAGYTAYSALRQARVRPGDRVAVLGIGGVGHLAIQYARGLGATVLAVTRDPSKEPELRELGAAEVLSPDGGAVGAELSRVGGADVAIITAGSQLEAIYDGLRVGARVALVAVGDQSLQLQMRAAVLKRLTVIGSSPGSRRLLQELLAFHFAIGAHSEVEQLSLDAATEAFARVRDGQARYRVVFTPRL